MDNKESASQKISSYVQTNKSVTEPKVFEGNGTILVKAQELYAPKGFDLVESGKAVDYTFVRDVDVFSKFTAISLYCLVRDAIISLFSFCHVFNFSTLLFN